jgi:acyl-coenzyme A thioesterase PaaI-like protein
VSAPARIVVGGRFNGPPGSANGGYVAGLLARHVPGGRPGPGPGPAEVTLLRPPPLDTPLDVTVDGDVVTLVGGRTAVAQARPAQVVAGDARRAPTVAEAARAGLGARFRDPALHPYPTCFVCGPLRAGGDGLRLLAGPVAGTDEVAAVWTPDPWLSDGHGTVRPEFVWSALDCPGGLAVLEAAGTRWILLGRITVDVLAPLRVGGTVVCHARVRDRSGRTVVAESALSTPDGGRLATALAPWVTVA